MVLLFGEWLPLLVIFMTPLIPEPCRFAQQVRRIRQKEEKRRHERLLDVARRSATLVARDRGSPNGVSLYDLLVQSATLGCHSPLWDALRLTPPKWLLARNVAARLQYLDLDDKLIERDGGWAACERLELERAAAERGIDGVLDMTGDQLRRILPGWRKRIEGL